MASAGEGPPPSFNTFGQFYGALLPALGIAAGGLSAFLYLRTYLPDVYDPKRERVRMAGTGADEDMPPERPKTLWGWANLLYSMTDDDIVRFCGADALMYLRFLRLGLKMAVLMMVIGLVIILPVNATAGSGKQFDRYSMGNVPPLSPKLYCHLVMTYVITLAVLYCLYEEFVKYVQLRQLYLASPRVQSYSVIIRDIPRDVARDTVDQYLRSVLGPDLVSLHLVDNPKPIIELRDKKDRAALLLARSRDKFESSNVRPEHKTGLLGLCGAKVDSMTAYEAEIAQINQGLEALKNQEDRSKYVGAAIASFESIKVATAFRNIPLQPFVRFLTAEPAPAPNDVLWKCLGEPMLTRWVREAYSVGMVIFLIFCYTIPVAFVASLANLRTLAKYPGLSFLNAVADSNPAFTNFLQGFIPPLVLSIFFALVPTFMEMLSRAEMPVGKSTAQTMALHKVYWFVLFDMFLAYTFTGSAIDKVNRLREYAASPAEVMNLLAGALPKQATFFLNLMTIAALTTPAIEALRIGPLFVVKLKRYFLASSKWDHLYAMTADVNFTEIYMYPMLAFMVGVCYAPLQPLLLPAVVIYYGMNYCVWLNQLLYVYNVPFHTGGSQWPVIFRTCINTLLMSQILMAGVLALNQMATAAALCVPLMAVTLVWSHRFTSMLERVCDTLTLETLLESEVKDMGAESASALKDAYDLTAVDTTTDKMSEDFKEPLIAPFSVKDDGLLEKLLPATPPTPNESVGQMIKEKSMKTILTQEAKAEDRV